MLLLDAMDEKMLSESVECLEKDRSDVLKNGVVLRAHRILRAEEHKDGGKIFIIPGILMLIYEDWCS